MEKPVIVIEYCPKCHWLLRAAWMGQELLYTFESELGGVTLKPSEVGGRFSLSLGAEILFDRKREGGFPEIKEIKQRVRDRVAPDRDLGHSDTPVHHT